MVHTIQNKTAKKKSLKRVSTSHEADTKNIDCHRPVCTHIINLTQQQCRIIQSCQTIAKAWKISHFCPQKCLQACEKLLFVTFWGSWSTHKRNVILCTQTFLRATFWLYCWHSDSFCKRKAARCELPLSVCRCHQRCLHAKRRGPSSRTDPEASLYSCTADVFMHPSLCREEQSGMQANLVADSCAWKGHKKAWRAIAAFHAHPFYYGVQISM